MFLAVYPFSLHLSLYLINIYHQFHVLAVAVNSSGYCCNFIKSTMNNGRTAAGRALAIPARSSSVFVPQRHSTIFQSMNQSLSIRICINLFFFQDMHLHFRNCLYRHYSRQLTNFFVWHNHWSLPTSLHIQNRSELESRCLYLRIIIYS